MHGYGKVRQSISPPHAGIEADSLKSMQQTQVSEHRQLRSVFLVFRNIGLRPFRFPHRKAANCDGFAFISLVSPQ
jgi:hypothetical protein